MHYEEQLHSTLRTLEDLKEQILKLLSKTLDDIKTCQQKLEEYNAIR